MRKWSEVHLDERVEGEHIFCIGMVVSKQPWYVCRWCQQFERDVRDKPCKGIMKVHLN